MKWIILSTIFILLFFCYCDQIIVDSTDLGTIVGKVYRADTDSVISKATITTFPPTDTVYSFIDGGFSIHSVVPGNYKILAEKSGYIYDSSFISVYPSLITVINLTLNKNKMLILQEDFESYSVNSFPSSGGWTKYDNGLPYLNQIITNAVKYSGQKSLQMKSEGSLEAVIFKSIPHYEIVTFESWIKIPPINDIINGWVGIGLLKIEEDNPQGKGILALDTKRGYVMFGAEELDEEGYLTMFEFGNWILLRCKVNYIKKTMTIWVNDVLVLDNYSVNDLMDDYEKFFLYAYSNSSIFFDDIKIWGE